MKHMGIPRHFLGNNARKVPLNTILLPPLSPQSSTNVEIIGKLVNKTKPSNVNGEMVSQTQQQQQQPQRSIPIENHLKENARIAQLEQNIKFLQEQHELMLNGLHREIETLKYRNRELQFQLVFVKGSLPSSPSSPEDDSKSKVYNSPKPLNVTPIQIEILEKELNELKLQLQETDDRNVYLSAIVDEQKKKLERYEREREKERASAQQQQQQQQQQQSDPELLRKLDDAEAIIRRLRRENSDLRREQNNLGGYQQTPRSATSNQGRNGRHRGNNYRGSGGGGGNGSGGGGQSGWFPPLHTQNYWQNSRSSNNHQNHHQNDSTTNSLPSLGIDGEGCGSNSVQYHGGGGGGRRQINNNHYHNNGSDGKKQYNRGGYNKGSKPS